MSSTDGPSRPRTETASYRFPPAVPVTVPAPHVCTREDLIDLASGAAQHPDQLWALLGSSKHVAAICTDYARDMTHDLRVAEQQLEIARGVGASLLSQLETVRMVHLAALSESVRQQEINARVSSDNAQLRRELAAALAGQRVEAAFERVTVTITGDSYRAVADRLTASIHACRFVDDASVIDVEDTQVVDPGGEDERRGR